jgi:hypothetical protein
MHHDPDQLDVLWHALTGAEADVREAVLRRYAMLGHPDARPRVVCDDAHAQVLAVPTPDHPGRHVYARRPGGRWGELG